MGRLPLKLLWVPFLNRIVHSLGFRTEKAQMVVQNGVGHHRTRQILSSSLYASANELLIPFLRYCKMNGIAENNKNYLQWVHENCNNQRLLFYHITFSDLLSFNLYNEAARKNHSLRMMAVRVQFSPLFYSFKHPKYQKLHLRDLSVTNFHNRGQGGDLTQQELPN